MSSAKAERPLPLEIWVVVHKTDYEGHYDESYHLTKEGAEKQRLKLFQKDVKNYRSCLDEKGKALKEKMDEYKQSVQSDFVKYKVKVLP
jgi:hypothetical protein